MQSCVCVCVFFDLPFLTFDEGFKLPLLNCWEAKFKPDDNSCNALTSNTKRSALLQCSGACGGICGWSFEAAAIKADNGAHRESATSCIQSVRARTKFNFDKVSLCSRSIRVSSDSSGAWNACKWWWTSDELPPTPPAAFVSKRLCRPPVAPSSGSVNARGPSMGCWLLFSDDEPLPPEPNEPTEPGATIKVGLPNVGSLVRADGSTGELCPERLRGDCVWPPGLTCQVQGAEGGGVSDSEPPEVERCRPCGGVPMANCTAGGEMELISLLTLLLRWSGLCFTLMGWERGMGWAADAAAAAATGAVVESFGDDTWSLSAL